MAHQRVGRNASKRSKIGKQLFLLAHTAVHTSAHALAHNNTYSRTQWCP